MRRWTTHLLLTLLLTMACDTHPAAVLMQEPPGPGPRPVAMARTGVTLHFSWNRYYTDSARTVRGDGTRMYEERNEQTDGWSEPAPGYISMTIRGATGDSVTVNVALGSGTDSLAYGICMQGYCPGYDGTGSKPSWGGESFNVPLSTNGTGYLMFLSNLDIEAEQADEEWTVAVGDVSATLTIHDNVKNNPIWIYHDPDADRASIRRFDAAVDLMTDAGFRFYTRQADQMDAAQAADLPWSIMPRFFLGDPASEGWGPSKPKVNNGGLRWLRNHVRRFTDN